MYIPRAVCATCKVPLKPNTNGVSLEMLAEGRPYYKIQADEWMCPGCGARIFVGFAMKAIEHHEAIYDEIPVDVQVDL